MFSVNIKGKANPKDPQLVKLELVFFKTGYARVTKVINITGLFSDWDSQTQRFTSKGAEATEKNRRLLDLKSRYLKIAEDWEEENSEWSPVQWSHCFEKRANQKKDSKVLSVLQALDIIIERLQGRKRIKNGHVLSSVNTSKSYSDLKNTLIMFTKQEYKRAFSSYYFNEITEKFVSDYAFFLEMRGIENGNAGGLKTRLDKLYGLLFYANGMKIPDIDLSVFEQVKPKMKKREFTPKTLPREVILKIENIDRSLFTRLEVFYIDLFLFSYYTGGMANIDVAYLTWDCVDAEGRLCYERIKFSKKARIKLNDKARGIINKYKDKCFGNYVLPVFTHKHNTEKIQRGRLSRLCYNVNQTLAKLRKIIKYKEKITWYSARGTFITEMIAANVHPIIVAEMAGNSPATIYKHYFKNTDYKQTDALVDKVLGC